MTLRARKRTDARVVTDLQPILRAYDRVCDLYATEVAEHGDVTDRLMAERDDTAVAVADAALALLRAKTR